MLIQRSLPILLAVLCIASRPVLAQQPPAKPPAVGVVRASLKPVTPSNEYVGRIQAVERVNLVARVSAFLEERLFTEGAEVKKGDLLYRLEQGPFQADVAAKQAVVAQYKAQLQNADLSLARARTLLNTPAGQQSTVDAALANQLSLQSQMQGAEAQLEQSKINLGYTEIHAPIDGKIGRTAVTTGNYVTPNSGVLASIVSQDPIYVVFPVSTRQAISVTEEAAKNGGFHSLVVKLRLPDGQLYDKTGALDFLDNSVSGSTDTIALRAVLPNPRLPSAKGDPTTRRLLDGEFVTAILENARPTEALTIPRAAVLTDQGGDYVYVVGEDNKAQQRRIDLGATSPAPTLAVVASGLSEGESVIVDGIQRVRPGQPVAPGPAAEAQTEVGAAGAPQPASAPTARQ